MLGHHRIAGLLGRPLVVAVTGAVGMVLVVWGTAAPAVKGRSRWGGDVVDRTDAGWSTLVLQFACAGNCVPGDLGSDARGSDRLGAVLGSTSVAVLKIVAAWTRPETTVQAAGLQLAALYREARWSQHVLTETDGGRAVDAYRALDSNLHAAAAHRPVHGGRR